MRFTRSWSSSSEAVMTFEFAWKPRWATIRLVNSLDRSTFDISSAPPAREPRPPVPAAPTCGSPELTDVRNSEPPAFSRPDGLVNEPSARRPIVCLRPLLNAPVMVPSAPSENDCSVPAAAC